MFCSLLSHSWPFVLYFSSFFECCSWCSYFSPDSHINLCQASVLRGLFLSLFSLFFFFFEGGSSHRTVNNELKLVAYVCSTLFGLADGLCWFLFLLKIGNQLFGVFLHRIMLTVLTLKKCSMHQKWHHSYWYTYHLCIFSTGCSHFNFELILMKDGSA